MSIVNGADYLSSGPFYIAIFLETENILSFPSGFAL